MTSWAFPSVGFQAWCWSLDQLSCSLMHSMGDTWGEHVTLFYHTHAHAHTRLRHRIWSCDFAINNPFGSTVSLRPTVANGGQRRRWHHIRFFTLFWLLCMGLGFYAECILSCKMWCCTHLYVTWYKFIKSNIVSIYYTREIEDTLLGRSFSPDLSFILCPAADGISRTVTPTNHQHVQRELKTNPLKISWSPAAHHPPLTPTSDGARACTWKSVLLNMPRTKGNIHSLLIKNHWINPLQFEWSRDVEEHWTHGDYPQWWTTLKQLKVILFLLLSC